MTRILVTGASGLVGHALCALDGPIWIPVCSKDADLRELTEVRELFKKHAPIDGIIHLAANVGGLYKNMKKPVDMLEDNILMNTNLLKVAHENNVQRVICFLSTCVFPDPSPSYPVTSDMLHKGHPHSSVESYAFSKRVMEIHCRAYRRQYAREYFCVVPPNIYGPYDNLNIEEAHVIPALIHKCLIAHYSGTSLRVEGDGTPLRQFMFSEDIARLTLWLFNNYKNYDETLMLCAPGCEVSIKQVLDCIIREVGFTGPVEYGIDNGQMKKTADIIHVQHDVSFTSLEEGIQKTVKWFKTKVPGGTISSILN